jgi:hypothetical protein
MVLTILSLVIGCLTISLSTALLYAPWMGSGNEIMTPPLVAFAAIGSLGFATLSGWLTALIAQKAPIVHAIALSLIVAISWGLYTFTGEPQKLLSLSLLNLAVGTAGIMAGGWLRLIQIKARAAS